MAKIIFHRRPAESDLTITLSVTYMDWLHGSFSFLFSTLAFLTNMSEKCKSTSLSAIQVKNRWQTISIDEKLDIISWPEKSEWIVDICHIARLTHSGGHTIHDDADRTEQSVKSETNVNAKRTSYWRNSTMEHMEKLLNTWIEDQNNATCL